MEPMLQVRNLTKVYRTDAVETVALRGVTLDIRAGDFVAIAGPSGSGKSTLLHLMGGLDHPTGGEIWFEGQRIDRLGRDRLAHLRLWNVGYVFQAYNLIPVLTALENAAFVLELRGVGRAERERLAYRALEQLGVAHLAHRRPNQLSGGEQQRVAVARALAAAPRVILADEPTANLDSRTGRALIEHLQQLNAEQGITFVFSTHDPRLLAEVRRTVHLVDGQVAAA